MKDVLRRFNDAGVAEFTRQLERMRAGGAVPLDATLATDPRLTEIVAPNVRLEKPAFRTKREAGVYLSDRIRDARAKFGDNDQGLWTWLAAWHWDAICPAATTGSRRVLNLYHYVYGVGFSVALSQSRHLIAVAVRLYELAPASKLMLETPFHTMPKVVSEISGRLALTRIKALPYLLDTLYWDPKTRRQKPGAVDPRTVREGDLMHRLPARVKQLEMTYDLVDLTADQLLNLLGDEFRQWADSSSGPRRPVAAKRESKFLPPPPPPGVAGRPAP